MLLSVIPDASSRLHASRMVFGTLIALTASFVAVELKSLRAETFILDDGKTIEGTVAQATKSSLAIRRTIGGLQLVALSRISEVKVELLNQAPLTGRLLGWSEGVLVLESEGKILDVRDGEILSETPLSGDQEVRNEPNDEGAPRLAVGESASDQAVMNAISTDADALPPQPAALHQDNRNEPLLHSSVNAVKEGQIVVFSLWLSEPAEQAIAIIYTLLDDSAKAGSDFEGQQGVVIFRPGESSTEIETQLIDDDVAEQNEQFTLFLSADPEIVQLQRRELTAIIVDDD